MVKKDSNRAATQLVQAIGISAMTDTNHIAVQLAEAVERLAFQMPAPNPWTPQFVQLATTAKVAALSARASAGEGGECPAWALMKGDEFVNVSRAHDGETPDSALPTFLRGAIRSVKEAKRQGYHVVPARVVIDTTTPQPAQAGASGGGGLTFGVFRAANVARCIKWHPEGIASWSPSDWLTAVTGELGELASLLKMRNRERDGLAGNKFSPTDKMVADELADVLTYLDLLAEVLGVDLGRAAVDKFNEVSERVGFPDRITLTTPASPATGDAATWEEEIRRHDATPPAHGDGEGDDPFGDMPAPIGNPEAWPPNYADGYNDAVRNMVDSFPSVRARLTTRPTPEAQEARDGQLPPGHRWLDPEIDMLTSEEAARLPR